MAWDLTRLEIAGSEPSESELWTLHERIWKEAFASLGESHKLTLHSLDSNVTIHPNHPSMWFYPGRDTESRASTNELVYSFPADEFNNPVFAYVPVHHWFRLGLAMGRERINELARTLELSITLPGFDEVLGTSSFTFAFVEGKLTQLHEGLGLLSENGWIDAETLPESKRDNLTRIWDSKLCECPICPRVRQRARAHAWTERVATLTEELGSGARLFDAMFDQPQFPAEAKAWRAKHGAELVATDPAAVAVLERRVMEGDTDATGTLASALRRKTKLRARHVEALVASLSSRSTSVLRTLLGVRLEKSDYTPALLDALESALPFVNFEPTRSDLAGALAKRVDWTKGDALRRLATRLASDDANTRYVAALLTAHAFNAAKAAGKAKLLHTLDRALGASDARVVDAALHAKLRKKDFDADRLELLMKIGDVGTKGLLRLVELFATLDWKAPKHLEQQAAIARRFFASSEPAVRKAAVKTFLPSWSTYREMNPKQRTIFDELARAASENVHPEFGNALLCGYDGLSKELRDEVVRALDVRTLNPPTLARRAEAFPELKKLHESLAIEQLEKEGRVPSFSCSSGAQAVSAARLAATCIAKAKTIASLEEVVRAFERGVMLVVLARGNEWTGSDGRPLASPDHPDLAPWTDALRDAEKSLRAANEPDAERLRKLIDDRHERSLRRLMSTQRFHQATWVMPVVRAAELESFADALVDYWGRQGDSAELRKATAALVRHHARVLLPAFQRWSAKVGSSHSRFVGIALAWSAMMNNALELDASIDFLDAVFELQPHADFLYNKACALIRRPDPTGAAAALATSIEMLAENRDYAKKDADFGKYLDHPAFAQIF